VLSPPLRIAVLAASPAGLPRLDLDREQVLLKQAWCLPHAAEVTFLRETTVDRLREELLDG
jgi:hypothetical protein